MSSIESFFNPKSVAVIGASANPDSISGRPIRYMQEHGYQGKIYPINPKYDEIAGLKCYKSILDIPDEVDQALVAVNYKLVMQTLNECAQKGVKHALVFSSGFAESGEEGKKIQDEIVELSKKTGLRVLGPNCQGMVNLLKHIPCTFSASLEIQPALKGSIGFVTQSGALGYSIFNLAQESGVGFSYVVSTGNEVDLNSVDFVEYLVENEETSMIITYTEDIKDGKRFKKVADRALELGKPIVCIKVGSSEVGQKAAASHTAALTGSDTAYTTLFNQRGIIRVDEIRDAINFAIMMERIKKIPDDTNLGIITTSGGAGILLADKAEEYNLNVPELDKSARDIIEKYIPAYGSSLNPVDVTAQVINDPDDFKNVLQTVADYPGIDGIVIVISMIYGASGATMARCVVEMKEKTDTPILVTWPAGDKLMKDNFDILTEGYIPWYKSPEQAVKTLGSAMKYGKLRKAVRGYQKISDVKADKSVHQAVDGKDRFSEHDAKEILAGYGLPITREKVVNSSQDAARFAEKIGFPVVLKIDSPDILHKTDVGALKLNLASAGEVEEAYQEIMENVKKHKPDASLNGILVQEMVKGGKEMIVGINKSRFGPMVMVGLGGIFVEVLKDVSYRIAPFTREEALQMLEELNSYKILTGVRGEKPSDINSLADMLVKMGQFAFEFEDKIAELDINPVMVLPEGQGVKIADALISK